MSVVSDLSTLSANNGESIIQTCGFHPMVAVLSSNGADVICKKNNLPSFADLLAPFSNITIVIKDPIGAQVSTRVKIDFRDIAKSGCLLSLTVLPSVLDQVVSSISSIDSVDDVWSLAFRDSFFYWFEPAENDFLKSYLCCIFVVSAEEEDPLGELARLIQKQNTQQHGGSESTTALGPPQCSSPKWFLPNILKSYVLLSDVTNGNEEKANEIFNKMSAIYGNDCCFFLKVNSEQEASDLPDPWQQILEQRYRGLESGLEHARRKLMEVNNTGNNSSVISPTLSSSSLPIATTFSSSFSTPMFSTVSSSNPVVPLLPTSDSIVNSSNSYANAPRSCGQCLSTCDREVIREFVERFVKQSLVPFVEKQIMAQNDILQNRRGIGKSFTSMRKWLSAASSQTAPVSYGPESTEIQTRRLADLSFLFGLFAFAHSLYQTVKKDFANDNAKIHHAGALEMATLTFYLSSISINPKQIPIRYLDAAMDIYMTECNPLLALRCCMISVEILSRVSMFGEAANQLIRLTSNRSNQPGSEMLSDFYSGVLLEKAANLLFQAKMHRRRAFHFVLAGHRFNQAGQKILSLKCYNNAAEEYLNKKWQFAENHIIFTLIQGSNDAKFQMDCVTKLINPTESRLIDQPTQMAFMEYFIRTMAANDAKNIDFVLPFLDPESIKVIYGEKPDILESEIYEWKMQEEKDIIRWENLERICFHATAGNQKPFLRECPMFSDYTTKNQHKKETSPFERFRVQFKLLNSLLVPLTLKNLKLGVDEIVMKSGHSENEAFIDFGIITELILPPSEPTIYNSVSNENNSATISESLVELYVIPSDKLLSFSVKTLHFDLIATDGTSISGKKEIILKKKRLFKTKEQRMKKFYATDFRLSSLISTYQWPLLNVEFSGQAARSKEIHAYCNQIFQVMVTFENIGVIPINAIAIGTDQPENVSISEFGTENQQWILCSANLENGLLCHSVSTNLAKLQPKSKLTIRMAIKAPDEVVENRLYRILFFYLGENGYYREHRYSVKMSTKPLLRCIPKVLNETHQLCGIELKNLIPARDAVLAKVEFLRLTCIFTTDDDDTSGISLNLVIKRQVIIEGEQSDIIPFYIKTDDQGLSVLWLSDSVCDIPRFNNIIKYQFKKAIELLQQQGNPPSRNSVSPELPRAHLRFELLWKAHVAGITGNVSTLFGESWIPNPFSLEYLNKYSAEPIEEERKFYNTGISTLNGKFAMILTEQDRLSFLATKTPTYNQLALTKKEIPWRLPTVNFMTELDRNFAKTISCKILVPSSTIIHEFKTKKECRFDVSLEIFNSDPLRRRINVIVHTGSDILDMRSSPIHFKESDKDPMNVKTNVLQPKLTVDKVRINAKIDFGETNNFSFKLKAFQACAYNLTEVFAVEACIEDENVEIQKYHRLMIPLTYILIKPSKQFSRESTKSPHSMFSADSRLSKARV